MKDKNLTGKVALVTGAAHRIGREIALALADAGADVIVHCNKSIKEAEEVAAEISARKKKAWVISSDLENEEECTKLISRAIEKTNSLNILVNNVSIIKPNTIANVSLDDLTQHMQINAWAPLTLCREFKKQATHGKIVNLLDARLDSFDFNHVAYMLSKQALAWLTKIMAIEFAPDISVNAVSPGLILPPEGKDESYLNSLIDSVPLKKHGKPHDVAQAVIYLITSEFLTGQIINVDGGRHLHGGRLPAKKNRY